MLSFEWTVKLGDVLTLGGALFVAAAFLYRRGGQEVGMKISLDAFAEQMKEMQTEIKELGKVLINQADQNRRIIHLEEDLRLLRTGRGWIQGPHGIDREYGPEE